MMEAFAIGIRLKLLDSVSSGLVGMAGQFAAFNRSVAGSQANLTALETQLKRIKTMGLIGGIAAGAGVAGLSLFSAPLKAAREYELAFTKFKTLNLGDAVNEQANHFARSADIMGVSAKQLMTTMSESVGIFGGYAEAQKLVPMIAQLNAANSAIFKGKIGDIDEGATRSLALFMDRRGLTKDASGFKAGLDLAERMVTGSGGFIQFKDLAAFSQQAGTAFRGLSDTGLTNMAQLLQEQGGSRAGTALMSVYQNLIAGRTPKKTMGLLQDLRLGHISEIFSGSVGGRQSTTTKFQLYGPYANILQQDPVGFFDNIVIPKLAARGITSQQDILRATNDLLSNRTASNQASIMTTQVFQIMRDAALTRNAMGAGQVIGAYQSDPNSRWGDIATKYTNLMVELGETVLPLAIKGVEGLTTVIKSATSFAREFPALTRGLTTGFAVISGLVAVGGALTLATAGFKALGLALTIGKAGGIGGLLAETALGLGGPLGLIAGIVGLGVAVAGAGWLLNKMLPKKDDGQPHEGQHWVPGQGRSGAGGSWEDDMRWVGPARSRHQEFWNPAANTWGTGKSSTISPYIAAPITPVLNVTVTNKVTKDGLTTLVMQGMNKLVSKPQVGVSGFDGGQSLAPAGGVGGQ